MPKETFFNLHEDKRALIFDVAVNEFAKYPFEQASVNRIVENSGIAKGSFYQYFEDKKDLFLYLLGRIREEKLKYLSPILLNPDEHDLFTVIRELFRSGMQFASEQPKYAAIGNKLIAQKGTPIYRDLMAENLIAAQAVFEPLIVKAIDNGDVRADININLLNHLITSINVIAGEYWSENYPHLGDKSMIETIDTFMDILKNGIGHHEGTI